MPPPLAPSCPTVPDPPYPTISVYPVLPATATSPVTDTISGESRYIRLWYSDSGGCTSPPTLVLLPPSTHPNVVMSTNLSYHSVVESPKNARPTCGGNFQGSAQLWESSPMSLIQTRGFPGRPPCKTFRISRCLPPPFPETWKIAYFHRSFLRLGTTSSQ